MKIKSLLVVAVWCFAFAIALAAPAKPAPQVSDKIVAVVNSEVITQSELNDHIAMMKQQFVQSGQPVPADAELRSKMLNNLIDTTLQLQLAKKNNLKVTDADIDNAIKMIAAGNHMSVPQFKQALAKSGMNEKVFRTQLQEQITLERMQGMLFGREINVSDAEIAAVLSNPPKPATTVSGYHVLDVLIPLPDHATAQQTTAAEKEAQTLYEKLPTVSDVAKFISNKTVNGQAITSNDLGWRRLTDMPELFAAEVVKLSVGNVSRPIQAPNGFHVLKLLATQGGSQQVKLTKSQAEQIVFHRKMSEKINNWVKELRAAAYVKINE